MASISTGSGGSGKRAVDHEIPLIPFIDLLLCCVMFLLVTAVWNQLAEVSASLRTPSPDAPIEDPHDPQLVVRVAEGEIVIGAITGERTPIANLAGGEPDLAGLVAALRPLHTDRTSLTVVADDGVRFETVIAAMDAAANAGFDRVTMSDGI